MGMLDFFKKKEEVTKKKKEHGVCIPVHALPANERKKKMKEKGEIEEKLLKKKKPSEEDIDYIDSGAKKEVKTKNPKLDVPTIEQNISKEESKKKEPEKIRTNERNNNQKRKPLIIAKTNKDPLDLLETIEEIEDSINSNDKKDTKKNNTKEVIKDRSKFKITGVYDFGSTAMISGVVEYGYITSKMRSKENKNEIHITEIKIGPEKVKELQKGQEGSLFVKTKGNPILKYGQELYFE